MAMKPKKLPVVVDCEGCGVCCLHMGYPAFMLPRSAFSSEQIQNDPQCQKLLEIGWTEAELLAGNEGESYWRDLPKDLKEEWLTFTGSYQKPGELDGPCFWFDQTTRQCKNHQYRPSVCRDFEIGSKLCHQWRREYSSKINS